MAPGGAILPAKKDNLQVKLVPGIHLEMVHSG
jgi:hypothetical protein